MDLILGSMEIETDKKEYYVGEDIKGKIRLMLKKPIKARMLKITLQGTIIYLYEKGRRSNSKIFYSQDLNLGTEQTYQNEYYDFKIPIPANVYDPISNDIKEETYYKQVGSLKFYSYIPSIYWHLIGKLEVPSGPDVIKSVKIKVMLRGAEHLVK
ncbi:MAG: hypothetical protein QW400_04260 [Candidatus Diapherotrites archaeon]